MQVLKGRIRGGDLSVAPAKTARPAGGDLPALRFVGQPPQLARQRILIVITDQCRMSPVARALENAGFAVNVVRGWSPALESLQQLQPSLLLVCSAPETEPTRILRGATRAPILALLVGARESDMVDVLTAGADDCQPAALEPREIVMRVRALLRRFEWQQHPATSLPRRAA
jgi:two-component system, OmpR family, response regulator AdeR